MPKAVNNNKLIFDGDNMGLMDKVVNLISCSTEERLLQIAEAKQNIEAIKGELESFFHGKTYFYQYEERAAIKAWQARVAKALKLAKGFLFIRSPQQKELKLLTEQMQQKVEKFPQDLAAHNNKLLDEYIDTAYQVIGKVEGRFLDRQQMACVVKEPISQLVVAGAGTGKTTTIIGKVKYLLQMGLYKPEDILLLSFTRAAALEMKDRIIKDTGLKVTVQTIHSLGLNIVKKVEGKVPLIYQGDRKQFLIKAIREQLQDGEYAAILCHYLLFNHIGEKSEWDFHTQEEYQNYLKLNKPTSLKLEAMKSYGEVDIANFLALQGVEYQYEVKYKEDTRDSEYGQYFPDFYLPEYDIYIEYFGINRKGQVPEWFQGKEASEQEAAKTPDQVYNEGMEWKRKLHKEHGNILIECFAYEKFEHTLLEKLEKALVENGVVLRPLSIEELIKAYELSYDFLLEGLAEVVETIISLAKGRNFKSNNLVDFCQEMHREDQVSLAKLATPVMKKYEELLESHGAIDFADMINRAAEYVTNGNFKNPFKYVIVDEYQDLSRSQFVLLKALRNSQVYHLMAVGDDWQSIYRFNGSDISYIVDFENYWGSAEISRIETTYRFGQQLIDVSGYFILKNPKQLQKALKAGIEIDSQALQEIRGDSIEEALEATVEEMRQLPEGATVFLLGRYNFDVKNLDGIAGLSINFDKMAGAPKVTLLGRGDLDIHFYSAHKSKGLQADYVFIINSKKSGMGFPSQVESAELVELLLEKSDGYPYSEERRLFYVAMTRAKRKLYLVTVENDISDFVEELREAYPFKPINKVGQCPLCGGQLKLRQGPYGRFYGCSNYKSKGCRYVKKS